MSDEGKTMLVTGASRGIGRRLCDLAKATGWHVIETARTPKDDMFQLDVTSAESHDALATELNGRTIDALVLNAGIYQARGSMENPEYTAESFTQAMLTHVAGPFFAVRAFMPNLKASTTPRVAIIASRMGSNAHAGGGSYIYRASKAAAINLASNLAKDLKAEGIAVAAYHPGWVRTDMGSAAADLGVDESAMGLLDRIDALSLVNSGSFLAYDGQAIGF
ncbi:MAG: SDR family NAD(P)-dependent oxidoreductase [Pseudomonadota bacterium]